MKAWLEQELLTLIGVALVVLVAAGTIMLAPPLAKGIERMPWLIYMYSDGEPPDWLATYNQGREQANPLPLEEVGISGEMLRAIGIPVGAEPSYIPVEVEGTFPPGHVYTETADTAVLSARRALWRWETGETGMEVEVKVVELATSGWATALGNIMEEEDPKEQGYPGEATVFKEFSTGDMPYELSRVQFVHDRLWVVVQVAVGPEYLAAVEKGARAKLDTEDLARQVAVAVDTNLPRLRDLEDWETLNPPDARPLHAASMGVAASLAIFVREFGSVILDRGSREAIIRRPLKRRAVGDVDLSRSAWRRRVRLYARTVLLSLVVGIGAIVYYFVVAPVALLGLTWGMQGYDLEFIVAATAISIVTAILVLMRQDLSVMYRLSSKWRFAEVAAAVASAVTFTAGVFLVSKSAIGFALGDAPLMRVLSLMLLVGGLALVSLTVLPARLTRRITMPAIKRVLLGDDRAPVLFLRSFQDDDLRIRIRSSSRSDVTERLALLDNSTFEDLAAWVGSRFGPVTAIGQPGTRLQPLGAVRDYFDDDEWRTAVLKRINVSRVVMFVVGRSPGAQWELAQLRDRGGLSKTVFVFPPVSAREFKLRCFVLAAGLGVEPDEISGGTAFGSRLAAARLEQDGRVVRYLIDGRDDTAYDLALGKALCDADARRDVIARSRCALWIPELEREAKSLLVTYSTSRTGPVSTDPYRRAFGFFLALSRLFA